MKISGIGDRCIEIPPNMVQLVQYANEDINITSMGGEKIEVFVVNIHKSLISPEKAYFENLFPFVNQSSPASIQTFAGDPFPIGYQMRQIIEELAQKKYSGCFLVHFIEIKIMELLLLYINEWTLYQENPKQERHFKDHRLGQQMEQVRTLLLADLANTPGLRTLSNAVGTNEFHLKQHFKAYFGKPVMAYLRDTKWKLPKMNCLNPIEKSWILPKALDISMPSTFLLPSRNTMGSYPRIFANGSYLLKTEGKKH